MCIRLPGGRSLQPDVRRAGFPASVDVLLSKLNHPRSLNDTAGAASLPAVDNSMRGIFFAIQGLDHDQEKLSRNTL
jgi:hypothetical protein